MSVWQDEAACQGHDPELWFPERGDSPEPAREVCATCPVRAECLAMALADPNAVGVWGGTTAQERAKMRKGQTVQRRTPVPAGALVTFVDESSELGWSERLERWNEEHPERPFPTANAMATAWRYVRAKAA